MSIGNSVGHIGKYGHEFLEFEVKNDGRLRYANSSNYKSDVLIRKEGKRDEKLNELKVEVVLCDFVGF